MQDIEYIIAHLPENLDARFTGVEHKLAGIREVQVQHTKRFDALEVRIDAAEARLSAEIRDLRQLIEERLPKT
ncbi:MAG: hypothetical protein K8F92_14420 [Hyphomicrobium sp.]|uniref:hypothetical protein n=1 Tax=Hyphomicrobium sp. TaxID=82 RepID=UPI0013259CEB|nr:hypothetical protein [Hyphomicrobium sp.]KAB2937039.1 MAG: hypothetical protein F9K20_20655 [Hyphomicrobium sp.]MBZ0210830.1 hypothetical protein [Hyphomicrobium sp.]